jgi:hypothetical protein
MNTPLWHFEILTDSILSIVCIWSPLKKLFVLTAGNARDHDLSHHHPEKLEAALTLDYRGCHPSR